MILEIGDILRYDEADLSADDYETLIGLLKEGSEKDPENTLHAIDQILHKSPNRLIIDLFPRILPEAVRSDLIDVLLENPHMDIPEKLYETSTGLLAASLSGETLQKTENERLFRLMERTAAQIAPAMVARNTLQIILKPGYDNLKETRKNKLMDMLSSGFETLETGFVLNAIQSALVNNPSEQKLDFIFEVLGEKLAQDPAIVFDFANHLARENIENNASRYRLIRFADEALKHDDEEIREKLLHHVAGQLTAKLDLADIAMLGSLFTAASRGELELPQAVLPTVKTLAAGNSGPAPKPA